MKTLPSICTFLLILLLAGCASLPAYSVATPTATPPPDMLALVHGLLIDGTGASPVQDAILLIQGNRIISVGPASVVDLPPGIRTIDLQGAAMLPGLINVHVHNVMAPGALEKWARYGVTTVRDLGEPVNSTVITYRNNSRDDPNKARLLVSGPIITVPEGYPLNLFPIVAMIITSPENAHSTVEELIDEGVDVIKIALVKQSGAVLSQEETDAIVATAHAHGIPVAAHVNSLTDGLEAVEAGVDDIDHMFPKFSDEQIQVLIEKGIVWVPTIDVTSDAYLEFKKFVQAGGIAAMGTDQDPEDGPPMRELLPLNYWIGLTPMQIITISTLNGAKVCHLEDELGSLEAGKLADILVVSGDPSTDLAALNNIRMVIHSGVIIRSDY